jgi:hypothetical protein
VIGATPGEMPVTIPVDVPIVATAVAPLDHTPPAGVPIKVIVVPRHTPVGPDTCPFTPKDIKVTIKASKAPYVCFMNFKFTVFI